MKFHRTLVQAVAETLQQIFVVGVYADKAVEQVLKHNPRWGSRDRRFIAQTVYGMVRWWRKLNVILDGDERDAPNYYHLFAVWQILNGVELPKWEEFEGVEASKVLERCQKISLVRKYRESIPDWLDEIGSDELGEAAWEKELHELNKEATVVLRVNTLKTAPQKLKQTLLEQGIEINGPIAGSALWDRVKKDAVIVKRQNLVALPEYKQGLFEVQDASSQLVAPFLHLKPGMTVIDACAGAGGKSLHIAAIMENKGKIISMDVEERKLVELKRRAERAGAKIIQTQLINAATISRLRNTADRLLLDVPCSGLGVLKRNPDAKWKLTREFIQEIKKVQQEIISNYSQMLKPGGIMIYATCSILPGENQHQVEQFLNKNKGVFEFIEDRKVLPSEGFDGFYMAAIRKL
ncbi:MAG: methyltransferase domain-containing protein [Bacteroidia bacterium]